MNRFSDIDCSFKRLTPVYGFRSEKLVSLEKALEALQSQIDDLVDYIKIAKKHCHYPSEHQLTRDESASIYLYTMEWGEQTLYRVLNRALRNENRQALKIWFPFLKLFNTALKKLPTVKETLWRGVPEDIGKNFQRNQIVTWWTFNSCSTSVNVIKDFLEDDKRSTLFLIEAIHGKQVSNYTEFQKEEEVILTMGTQFRVKGDPLVSNSLPDMVHLVEIDVNDDADNEAPTPSVTEPKYHKWKQHAITVAGRTADGQQLNRLSSPVSICVDQNKTLLIVDRDNLRVVRWESKTNEGTVVAGGNGEGNRTDQLNWPTDMIIDKHNRSIIIADCGNRRVIRWFDQNPETKPQILIDNIVCWGLAMDREGFLYVSDVEKNEVRRWKEGETQGTIVAGGNGDGNELNQLNYPSYLFVDDEQSVYVSDWVNHRVMKWRKGATEGVIVAGGNGQGNSLNQLSQAQGIVVDRWGQIYVVEYGNDRVMRWREGEREGEVVVGGYGEGQGSNQLNGPSGLSMDDEGNLYVADCENDRIQKFDLISS